MQTLSTVAAHPSGWDSERNYVGTPLATFSDLFVVMGRNRDSDLLTQSNWECALRQLGGESESVVIHRFGHWACGWVEYLCVTEDKKLEGQKIVDSIEAYPVLDEEDFSNREYEAACTYWENMSVKERVYYCQKHRCSIFSARRAELPHDEQGELISDLAQ